MARVPVRIFTNSVIATIVSLIGSMFCAFGALGMCYGVFQVFGGEAGEGLAALFAGFLSAVFGYVLIGIGSAVSASKAVRKLKKEVRRNGGEEALRTSVQLAAALYSKAPSKAMLRYISSVNPAAGELIESKPASRK